MPIIESSIAVLILWGLIGYLLGSIPSGVLLSRVMGLGDLRDIGSGNIGATNVLRTGNKKAAALTLLMDAGKGALAVLLARFIAQSNDTVQIAALMAMLGHCYPIWLQFKGGKGVATFLGILLAYAWPVGLGCCAAWVFGVAISRQSSMGALTAAAMSTFFLVFLGHGQTLLLGIALTLLIFWRHRANIKRIRAGTEPTVSFKS